MQVELNRIGENVERFFPRSISVILKKKSIETAEDFIYYENMYNLFRFPGTDIGSFDLSFHNIYNHLSLLSKIDAINKTDYGERSTVEHSIQIIHVQKIPHLKKNDQYF